MAGSLTPVIDLPADPDVIKDHDAVIVDQFPIGIIDARLICAFEAAFEGDGVTSADDFVESMGWQTVAQKTEAVERQLFPDLTPDEQAVVAQLQQWGDLQLNILSVKTNIPIGQLTALLFSLEMKGVVRPMAGATYHLIA